MSWKQIAKPRVVIGVILICIAMPVTAFAAVQTHSTHYQVNEVFFGSGGALNDCSTSYCAKESIGETTVGNPTSAHYQAHAGFNTDRTPYLQFVVNTTNINIGTLSDTTTATATATFSVKAYLASGYQVVTASNPPSDGSYTMSPVTTPKPSTAGTEQFGINLVQNNCPGTFTNCSGTLGANAVQVPSSAYSFGVADSATGYATANEYEYIPNSVIAYSNSSSGETDYTISYIFNISNISPGGDYEYKGDLIATATF
jgi:hypothetical protein